MVPREREVKGADPCRKTDWIAAQNVAHRGLHSGADGIGENSPSAITRAVQAGHAVEIDVRMTRDNKIIVFHDQDTTRLTGQPGCTEALTFAEMQARTLMIGGEAPPTLAQAIDLVDAQAPLYIEIKPCAPDRLSRLCSGVHQALKGYAGPAAIMSFDPAIVAWFRQRSPGTVRGWVLGRDVILNIWQRLKLPLSMARLRPDFLAVDVTLLPNPVCRRYRERGMPILTWTVRSSAQRQIGQQQADALIFERDTH